MFSVYFYVIGITYRTRNRHQQREVDTRWRQPIRISGSIILVTLERVDWTVVSERFSHIEKQVNYQAVEVDEVRSKWESVVCDEEYADSMTNCSETKLGGVIPTFGMDLWPRQITANSFTNWSTTTKGLCCIYLFLFVKITDGKFLYTQTNRRNAQIPLLRYNEKNRDIYW